MRRVLLVALVLVTFSVGWFVGVRARADGPPAAGTQASDNQRVNDALVQQIAAGIAGRQGEPAEQVFKNIQWLKGLRAGQLLTVMNQGYSLALGVACTHCHDDKDFASDEKRPKRAAREMAAMHRGINAALAKMEHLATPPTANRAINCSTCHRGAVNPR
jgi:hypothetical protein